jgi:hypothetical protein
VARQEVSLVGRLIVGQVGVGHRVGVLGAVEVGDGDGLGQQGLPNAS